ncbi:dipeptidase [Allosphingosinicella indica]|uniref:Membrane dipeptidase n=1 Tax=Allosphingosinicella indica TaxID=941907 RepID=A0A1X7GQB9_9SPHN|nr:dipeptidase [Allosphingosinicella indica]SMF72381.1 membrane dipeptidase [Allosphingosinicella indica]
MKKLLLAALLAGGCTAQGPSPEPAPPADRHKRILTLDTHLDTPMHFARAGWSFADRHTLANDLVQVDIPRMADGNLDGGFFAIYTAQGPLTPEGYAAARDYAFQRSDLIDATIARFPDRILPARTAADAVRIAGEGKLVAFKSMENSYALGEDLGLLAEFQRRGVRMAGPVHSKNNQLADSATDKARWNGLSPLGRQWVAEMNRLGMVIDASHSSDAAFDQMLELSTTPLILSHSGSRDFFDNPRNLDDARIRRLAEKGGAICVTTVFLSNMNLSPARAELFGKLEAIGTLSPEEQADLTRRWRELDKTESMWADDFDRFMQGVLHVIKVAGPDHVCFGADWDGGGGIKGIEDISALPKVTERLKAAGYSDADIEKMWSGNVLRILRAAEAGAAR